MKKKYFLYALLLTPCIKISAYSVTVANLTPFPVYFGITSLSCKDHDGVVVPSEENLNWMLKDLDLNTVLPDLSADRGTPVWQQKRDAAERIFQGHKSYFKKLYTERQRQEISKGTPFYTGETDSIHIGGCDATLTIKYPDNTEQSIHLWATNDYYIAVRYKVVERRQSGLARVEYYYVLGEHENKAFATSMAVLEGVL